jgi:hypothetical protein
MIDPLRSTFKKKVERTTKLESDLDTKPSLAAAPAWWI